MTDVARYFDYAATTPLRQEVLAVMSDYFLTDFGNPNSLHLFGLQAKAGLEAARETVAATIGAVGKEIIFTGSGTESNNLAILGCARRMRRLGKGNHVITSSVEHPSVREACFALEREGFEVDFLPVDKTGRVNPEQIRQTIRSNTILVSVMHGNNVVGTIQPIKEIGAITRQQGIVLHSDAVQSYGKIPVDVEDLQVDLLTLNAHKIGGPKGVAALYLRKGVRLDPIVYGGGQERGLRSATQNVAGIVGFAKAAQLAMGEQVEESRRLNGLRQRLIHRLQETIPGCRLNGDLANSLPTHLNISIPQIEGQALMLELDRLGFAVSSGSACSAGNSEPSYVLLAMGASREAALESLRITLGRTTTEQSVDALATALQQVVRQWRESVSVFGH